VFASVPATRFVAVLRKATTAPSALIAGANDEPFPEIPGAPGTWLISLAVPVARS
jgi:hypothetical protein